MPRPGLKPLLGILLSAVLLLLPQATAEAKPGWMNRSTDASDTLRVTPPSSVRLQEVAPPGPTQIIKRRLSKHRPQLQLLSPKADSINKAMGLTLSLGVEDWPVSRDPELGLGPHVALQVDDRPLLRIDTLKNGRAEVQLDDLGPGSHRFAAWAAYPWGEAVKSTGASLQWRLHQWQRLEGTQPAEEEPWLVPNPMVGDVNRQPLLLDWQLWNAPLQNLRDGDARWRVRISLDGDSFLVDHQDALWLKGSGSNGGALVQMELLDGRGEALHPAFNNRLIRLEPAADARPAWLKERLRDEELLRLSGEPVPEPDEQETDAAEATPTESLPAPAAPSLNTQPPANAQPEEDEEDDDNAEGVELQPSRDTTRDAEPQASETPAEEKEKEEEQPSGGQPTATAASTASPRPMNDPMNDPSVLRPESSLGGSARELLDADGRLRQP